MGHSMSWHPKSRPESTGALTIGSERGITPECCGLGGASCISEDNTRETTPSTLPQIWQANILAVGNLLSFVYEMARFLVDASCLCIELHENPIDDREGGGPVNRDPSREPRECLQPRHAERTPWEPM